MIAVGRRHGLRLPQVEEHASAAASSGTASSCEIPLKIGDIVQKVALARFSRTYSALIAAGVPMLEAIEITGRTSGNKVIEKAMDAGRASRSSAGGTIAAPMRDEPAAFPLMVTQMIARRRGDRRARRDALEDRRLLRGRGGRGASRR